MNPEAPRRPSSPHNAHSAELSSRAAVGAQTPRDHSPVSNADSSSNTDSHRMSFRDLQLNDLPLSDLRCGWRGTYSEYTTTTMRSSVPSLTYSGDSVTSSRYRASTSIASAVSGIPMADVNEPGSGPQHNGRQLCYECPFHFLRCTEFFLDKEAWKTHTLSHFRQCKPPSKVECPLCAPPPDRGSFQAKDDIDASGEPVPGSAWDKRMEHVAIHHELGWSLASVRPEFELYDYLWRQKIINAAAYRSLKGRMRNADTITSMMGGRRQDVPSIRLQRA